MIRLQTATLIRTSQSFAMHWISRLELSKKRKSHLYLLLPVVLVPQQYSFHIRFKCGNFFCALYMVQSSQNLQGCIFPVLQHFAAKFCSCTNFKLLNRTVVIYIPFSLPGSFIGCANVHYRTINPKIKFLINNHK